MSLENTETITNVCVSSTNGNEREIQEIPLNTNWTFWADRAVRGLTAAEYEENLKKVYTVSTVQIKTNTSMGEIPRHYQIDDRRGWQSITDKLSSFWSVYNNIPGVYEIQEHCSIHLMRGERRPVWEDDINRNGGSWRLKVLKQDSPSVWKELLLAAIGEQFKESVNSGDDICGISITVREKDDMIQIWNENSTHHCYSVMQKVHELLPEVEFITEFYRAHNTHRSYATG